ncbi:MAG: ABC transporter ATP-binding protein [Thermoplasmata archaeon]|uniref:ABC transporter ATP-binding protein n=1 Tax=Candidatus Sysuiplasma superficiale TaxID=2823368 RepID=A0A8J7YJ79_9ARCH|nr:ABC transporter ATP-binding protein [Candidatus Sysuiplasma superficiale]MBX8643861.1 ABC transporter ATP-binding protein [Candidatus Sysuiplasma superficiale]MCL4346755.1 ABC transporter ATP-binding protein [Candidatus Thermoplasmatota archaeon]
MIEVSGLSKTYGRRRDPAVKDVSFDIRDGEIVGLAGLNGAGKTTTISAITGIILPSDGQILVDGMDIISEKARASAGIGWVSEFPSFEQNARPAQLLVYYAGFHGMRRGEARERAEDVLKAVGLEHALDRKIRTYSQGMKKRFGLASAMLSDPQNYLLDEILNGLDPEGMRYVRNLLLEFRKNGKAVLLSTHILGVLQDLADRVLILQNGRVLEALTREQMRKLGKPSFKLRTDRIDGKLIELLSVFGNVSTSGEHVVISGIDATDALAGEISAAVASGGYRLFHLSIESESLEDHFLQLTRDAG